MKTELLYLVYVTALTGLLWIPYILDRIAKQVNMRVRQEGSVTIVQPDTPYFKTYRVNYVNMQRESESRRRPRNPERSSSGRKLLPAIGCSPRVEKYAALTERERSRRGTSPVTKSTQVGSCV